MLSLSTAQTIIAGLALAAPALAGPGSWFSVPTGTGDGFESVSAKFYIDPSSTWIDGYYMATQWSFTGHDVHYFGLQPRSTGATTGHLVYSVFGPGSAIGDPKQCNGGADGGSGVTCWKDIDFEAGRWYTIESTVVQTDPKLGRRWNGTLVDDAGQRTYIASFWTDESYGKLSQSVAQWLEWYKFNGGNLTPAERECQPKFKAHYGLPTAHVGGKDIPGEKPSPFEGSIDDKCATAANKNNYISEIGADNTLTITAGILNP